MARTVQLECSRCRHQQMHIVESTENDEVIAAVVRGETAVDGNSNSEAARLRRLESLPTSLPVGGIITPV